MLNAYLLVSCICVLVAATLYTFYWNRFFAAIIGLLLRIRFWNQGGSSIWIQIGSIHFSLLSGRVLLKDVRYHSSNQTIHVVKAQITWRYWLRTTATEHDLAQEHVRSEGFHQHHDFPSCRIKVTIHGLEWFLYNRTTAYDHIISQMQASAPCTSGTSVPRQLFSRISGLEGLYPSSSLTNIKAPPIVHAALNWVKRQMPYIDSKDLLPISILAFKCAILCGNTATPTLMVAECHSAYGTFGIVPSRSKCDLYKQLLNLKVQNITVQLVENSGYRGTMPDTGHSIRLHTEASSYADRIPLLYLSHGVFTRIWKGLKLYSSLFHFHTAATSGHRSAHSVPQQGLYNRVSDTYVENDLTKLEYAMERRVVEAPIFEFSYYADVVGEVPTEVTGPRGMGLESYDVGNGDLPPEWGMDFVIHNGIIRYGPWADRQRIHLQRTFFPSSFSDLVVSQRLKPGDKRIWTSMKIFIELRGETSLILPFREGSKDWQWDVPTIGFKPGTREHAFLHVTAGDSSSISYLLPMVIGPDGYESRLEVHLDSIQVTSSLNDSKLVVAESCRVHAALPAPLRWKSERKWTFTVSLRQPVISLLRDHINMVMDLSRDWTTGPPAQWHQFVPTIYLFEVDLFHFDFNLYANDQNIIDKPLMKDENTIVILRAPRFHSVVTILSNNYRPEILMIPFSAEISDLTASISLPKWNTQSLYSQGKEQHVLHTHLLRIQASYYNWTEAHPHKVDQLKLHVSTVDVSFKALGWVIRYFMVLRENYFGTFTHFTTLAEYLEKHANGEVGDPVERKYRAGKVNALQVALSLTLQRGSILLPAGLPGFEKYGGNLIPSDDVGASLLLTFPELQLDLRSHDHFMDMSLNVGETRGCILEAYSETAFFQKESHWPKEMLVIDGINITANRLFGPPPRTRTYVCVWEIVLGNVKAVFSVLEARIALAVLDAFRINYTDLANAPAREFSITADPDLTFIKLSLKALNATLLAGMVTIDVDLLHGLTIYSNDLQGHVCGKLIVLRLPLVSLKALVTSGSSRNAWSEAACVEFDGTLEFYASSTKGIQSNFLQEQDTLTGRAHTLLGQLRKVREDFHSSFVLRQQHGLRHLNNLYLPELSLPRFSVRSPVSRCQQHQRTTPFPKRSPLSSLSESDEDISEADRDARVARNRVLRPVADVHIDEGEEAVSDEDFDDEDFSDTNSSESGGSELDGQSPSKHLLSRYRHVTRRYKGLDLENFRNHEGSHFTLMHSPLSNIFQKPKSLNMTPGPLKLTSLPAANASRAIRIESFRGVEVWITPLITFATSCLRDEYRQSNISSEVLLDAFMVRYLTSFTASNSPSFFALSSLDITMHSILAHIAEPVHCQEVQEHPPSNVTTEPRSVDLAVHCLLSNFHFKSSPQDRPGLSADLQTACQTVSISLSNLSSTPLTARTRAEFFLSLDGIQMSLIENRLVVICKKQMAKIGPSDPEYIVSFVLSVKEGVDQFGDILHGWRADSSGAFPVLVRQVLSLTKEHAAVDPLSVIQPSLLVQRGVPHMLRTDPSFKFLFNIRFALRTCGSLLREENNDQDDRGDRPFLKNYLSNLFVDLDEKAYLSTLEMVYPTVGDTLPRPPFLITSVSCSLGSLHFSLLSFPAKSHSYFSATTLHIKYQSNQHALSPLSRASISHSVGQTIFAVDAMDLAFVISPHLIDFIQRVVRVQKCHHLGTTRASFPSVASPPSLTSILFHVATLDIQAGAENLTFELGGSSLDLSSSVFLRPDFSVQSANSTFGFTNLHLRALSKVNISTNAPTPDILASLALVKGNFSATRWNDHALRLVFSLEDVTLSIPRSALRLYRFIEEWKTDFLPGFEIAAGSLISEIKGVQSPPSTRDPPGLHVPPLPSLLLNGTISSCGVILQIMRGTWVSWIIRDTVVFTSSVPPTAQRIPTTFGFQLQSQTLSIFYKSRSLDDSADAPRVEVILPALALTGNQGKNNVDLLVALEFANVMLKPSHWDSLLAVQQKFGRDFTDLMALIQETRQARQTNASEAPGSTSNPAKYTMHVNVKGFRVGLEGPTSTLYLECENVVGYTTKKGDNFVWKVRHRDIALSLVPRLMTTPDHLSNRSHRSAFIVIDVVVSADSSRLVVSIPKIHAVMQPSSIGELGDFIDYQQAELLVRRRQRATELEAFKQKTRTILKTFEIPRHEENASWLSKYSITVDIERIGVAFPLSFDQIVKFPGSTSDASTVRAFLFSVRRIRFNTQKGEVGYMTARELSFQFTDRFRQWDSSGFPANYYTTPNCLCYPEMKIHLRADASQRKRRVCVTGNVGGFVLDLDSSISLYVFSLIDVYRQGRERMQRLASRGTNFQEPESSNTLSPTDDHLNDIPSLDLFAALVFDSGQIRMRSSSQQPPMSDTFPGCEDHYESTTDIQTIKLPVLSAWIEYRVSVGIPGVLRSTRPAVLIFKSKIHSSQNTLNPSLLPFITQLADEVQARLRKRTSGQDTRAYGVPECNRDDYPRSIPSARLANHAATSSLQINLSLRIDKSTLELTCQPDVNVVAALRWDSGGFVVSISPGTHGVAFTGSVDGLTVGLKHGFLSEDCINLTARNLAFSLAFSRLEGGGNLNSSISLLVSTDITGGIRFSRLQDILCFKAVWLDRIPFITTQNFRVEELDNVTPPLQLHDSGSTQEYITAIVVYIRRTDVTVDLGQSICAVTLNLNELLVRTRISDSSSAVSLSVGDVSIAARGNISGYIVVPNCIFQTVRRSEDVLTQDSCTARLLELTMTSGALEAEVDSEQQRLLTYRADPIQVDIHDDWSLVSSDLGDKDRPLLLAFTVHGQGITALTTIATIPKFMLYSNRFKASLVAQKLAASRESEAFRATQISKPSNPLTDVASAFFQSARKRIKADLELSYLVRQQMSFRLEMLRLILFPRTMADGELASFVGRDVHASLHRTVQDALPPRREIHLSFTTLNISKFSRLQSFLPASLPVANDIAWVDSLFKDPTESNIIGLPPMKMLMITEESTVDSTKHLLYDFYSTFQGRGERKLEDIYITLNVALYSWLTGLRKNLSREMDQLTAPTNNVPGSRKKAVLSVTDLHPTADRSQLVGEVVQHTPESLRVVKQSAEAVQEGNVNSSTVMNTPLIYEPRERKIQKLTLRQLGEATPDVMHPFFMKKSGFNLEDSLPQYVHEYATLPLEEIMEVLLNLYSKQLPDDNGRKILS